MGAASAAGRSPIPGACLESLGRLSSDGMTEAAATSAPHSQRSLFGDILDWMLVPLLLLWPLSVLVIWLVAQSIANKPFDRELGELAHTMARRVTVTAPGGGQSAGVQVSLSEAQDMVLRSDPSDTVYFQVLGLNGEWVAGDRDLPVPIEPIGTSGELQFRDDEVRGQAVRVAYLWRASAQLSGSDMPPLIQVAETLDKRSQLTTEIARGVMLSQFAILPLAVLLVWFALLRGFRPLNELQLRIRRRASDDLSPLDTRLAPDEVSPLVAAINDLLARLDRSIAAQKHFLADAAHQLKTPLAGLRMQAELAQREVDAGGDAKAARRSLQQIAARVAARRAHGQPVAVDGARRRQRTGAAGAAVQPGGTGHGNRARLRAARDGAGHRPGLRRGRT